MRTVKLVISLLAGIAIAVAQTDRGTITGTLSDATGAVVAGAAIEARNVATGQVYPGNSTATGNFTISNLPPGAYELTANVQGFKKYARTGLNLAPTQTIRLDVALEVGSNTETVTVTAEATLLKTETGEVASNVTGDRLNNLPLLGVGPNGASAAGIRNPWALSQLVPGAQFTIAQGTGFFAGLPNLVVNGAPAQTASYRIEGMDATPNGTLATFTFQVQPSAEAIQEVAVQTSNFAAEFGTVGGGLFNATMRSGTNQYHGSLYDYNVNEAYNAAQPYTGLRNKARRNDYGGSLGGPIRIPKLYNGTDKSFFFWSFEQFRENQISLTQAATVPIAPYLTGDFGQVIVGSGLNGVPRNLLVGGGPPCASDLTPAVGCQRNYLDPLGRRIQSGAIFDPSSTRPVVCSAALSLDCVPGSSVLVRDQFPNNVISNQTLFDPVALKIQKLIPSPVGPNRAQIGNNYNSPQKSNRTTEIPSLKLDQTVGPKGHLSFYWSMTNTADQFPVAGTPGAPEGFPPTITSAIGNFVNSYTLRLNYDHSLTPTMLLHLGVGYLFDHLYDDTLVTNYDALKELGLKGATVARNFPTIVTGASPTTGGMSQMGPSFQTHQYIEKPTANASLTWVRGNHSLKLGGEFRIEGNPNRSYGQPPWTTTGSFTFGTGPTSQTSLEGVNISQGSTGFAYSSFLLGKVTGYGIGVPAVYRIGRQQWGLFVQDTWKITRKLTLDYGLRWDYGTYSREQYGRSGQFAANVPNPSAGGHPGAVIFEANCNCRFANNYPYAIGPRIGFAYQANSKTVVRGGIGIVYNNGVTGGFAPLNYQTGGTPGFGQSLFNLQDGPPSSIRPVFPNISPGALPLLDTVGGPPINLDPNNRPARQLQWSIGVQRELSRNVAVEVSYVANRGVWWNAGGLAPVNSMSVDLLKKYGFTVGNVTDAGLLNTQIAQLNPSQKSLLATRGVALPYSTFPTNQTVLQSLLPYPQYTGNISPAASPLGATWYDSLQATVTQRFSRGLTLNGNFTWSKNLDLMSSPDIFNRQLGKNLSANDLPLQFRVSAQYTTPRTNLFNSKLVSYILGDWNVGLYMQYQSAPILAPPTSASANSISRWLGRPAGLFGPTQPRAERIANVPIWSTNWTDYDGVVHTDPIDINCHCFDPTKTVVFNTSKVPGRGMPDAWANVPDGQWSSNLSSIRDFRGFRAPTENFNFGRTFRIKEKMTFNIRAEFANVLNRTRLPQPSTAGFTANPTTFTSGVYTGLYSGGFGTINPTSGTLGQRSGTLVGRITF